MRKPAPLINGAARAASAPTIRPTGSAALNELGSFGVVPAASSSWGTDDAELDGAAVAGGGAEAEDVCGNTDAVAGGVETCSVDVVAVGPELVVGVASADAVTV